LRLTHRPASRLRVAHVLLNSSSSVAVTRENQESDMDPLQVLATFAVCAIPIVIAFKGQREAD